MIDDDDRRLTCWGLRLRKEVVHPWVDRLNGLW